RAVDPYRPIGPYPESHECMGVQLILCDKAHTAVHGNRDEGWVEPGHVVGGDDERAARRRIVLPYHLESASEHEEEQGDSAHEPVEERLPPSAHSRSSISQIVSITWSTLRWFVSTWRASGAATSGDISRLLSISSRRRRSARTNSYVLAPPRWS